MHYFSLLTEPLVPYEIYDSVMLTSSKRSILGDYLMLPALVKPVHQIRYLSWLFSSLNSTTGEFLHRLLHFLYDLSSMKETNQMDSQYLARMFGPILFRPLETLPYMEADSTLTTDITQLCIENWTELKVNMK